MYHIVGMQKNFGSWDDNKCICSICLCFFFLNSVVKLYLGTISVFLICSSWALLLSLFLSTMCPPQGAEEEDCFCMHGCERKIQHPFACWDTHGWLSLVRACVKNTHAMARDSLSQSLTGGSRPSSLYVCVIS